MSRDNRPNLAALKRLPSLKPTRDVNLSGQISTSASNACKPRFTPNLALAGKRTQLTSVESAADVESAAALWGNVDSGRKKGRREQPREVVQSTGLFADGFGDGSASQATSKWSAASERPTANFRGSCSTVPLGSGRFAVKAESKIGSKQAKLDSTETDEAVLSCLLKDHFISDLLVGSTLPLSACANDQTKNELKDRFEIKNDLEKQNDVCFGTTPEDSFVRHSMEGTDEKFVILQLPSVLSKMILNGCEGASTTSTVKQEIKVEPEISVEHVNEVCGRSEDNFGLLKQPHVLENVPCGYLGKLQILKSGKIRLKLNTSVEQDYNIFMDVDISPTSFAQQLVLIDEMRHSLNVLVSDVIEHRILVTPDIESIACTLESS